MLGTPISSGERVLGCPARYGRQTYETIFHRDHLSLPLPTADSQLLKVLTKHTDQMLQERAEEGKVQLQELAFLWASLRTPALHQLSSGGPARRRVRRGACLDGGLQVARRLDVLANQTKATGSEGMIRWRGSIDVAPELGADGGGGNQHGGQLMFQRCS